MTDKRAEEKPAAKSAEGRDRNRTAKAETVRPEEGKTAKMEKEEPGRSEREEGRKPEEGNMAEPEGHPAGQEHHRRPHYAGKYPRHFEEKYKEMAPEKYADQIGHVIAKGNTPAGMHLSIMVDEVLDVLKIRPGQQGLDCTLGYGGHSREMLKCLQGQGHLCALDVDPIESEKTLSRLRGQGFDEKIFSVHLTNFARADQIAAEYGAFDFVLADLGVSSMQIDNPARGFSYKTDGPLDLRMNPFQGESGADRLNKLSKEDLESLLIENSDEPYAREIAKEVYARRRKGQKMVMTADFREAIGAALSFLPEKERKEAVKKSCQRCFQALRIDVNQEMEALDRLMQILPEIVKPGGRIAVLTFHSGEDRLVKKAFQYYNKEGIYSEIAQDVIRPSGEECIRNPRAHSTKLRWAVRSV